MNRLNRDPRTVALASVLCMLAVAVPVSLAASSLTVANDTLAVRCTETLKSEDVSNGGVAGNGLCTLSGAIVDRGAATDYRRVTGTTARIRRVVVGRRGTITFLIAIDLSTGSEPWSVLTGTKTYRGLRGKGSQVVDRYDATPAVFVMKGTVSR